LFICFAQFAIGQTQEIDSLQQLIDHEGDTKKKVELINALSFLFFADDVERANSTTEQALQLATKIGDRSGEGWALAYRGLYYFFTGDLPTARSFLVQAHLLGQDLQDQNLQTYSLTQLGNVYRDKGDFDSAVYYYRSARKVNSVRKNNYYESVIEMNIGRYYLIVNKPDSALQITQEAMKIRERLKDQVRLADALILMGNCYLGNENFTEAARYYEKAVKLTPKDLTVVADYHQNMGEVSFRRGDFEGALENWSKVLAYHRQSHYKYGLAALLLRMGKVFDQQGYFNLATDYLTNALRISEKSSYQYLTGQIIYEQTWVNYRSKNFNQALVNLKKAEHIFRITKSKSEIAGAWDLRGLIERRLKHFDSALYYHQKSLEERMRLGNKVDIDAGLFNIGEFYLATAKFTTALPYYFKSLKIEIELGDNYGKSLSYNRIANVYINLSRFDSAKIYLEKSMELAVPTSANEIFRDNYLDFAAYYEKIGKPNEAISYYKKYNKLTDSIFSKQTAQSLAAYQALYEVERNEQQIELLNKDNKLNRAIVQRQQTVLYSLIGGSIILLVLAGFYFRFSRKLAKLNREIFEQKEEIQAQAEELTESNQTISGINEKLEERIEERTSELKQAFKELDTFFYRSSHDFRRPITTFMGLAEVARVLVKDPAALELFEKVNENALNLDKMLRKLQSVSNVDMQTLIYKEVHLKEIFEIEQDELKSALDKKKIRTLISVKLDRPFYSYGALIKIIVQNLLENAISFSTNTSPVIYLSAYEQNSEVVIEVRDNGLGIEPEYVDRVFEMYFRASEHSKGNGLGLYIVKKTVQKLNGRVELHSELGKGTTIKVFLPLKLD
jgi:signal transduction histidine kinase